MLIWLLACTDPIPPQTPMVDAAPLVRASMAIRGIRPSPSELGVWAGDPSRLEGMVRGWLTDPRFGQGVRDQHAQLLHLRTSAVGKMPPVGPLAGTELGEIASSLDEAPLYLVEDVVVSGRPYTELLTTDRTFANRIVATVHGLPYDANGPEWQATTWADGRPAAGLLADTAILQRFMSSNTNFHRARAANALTAFVCEDLLARAAASPPALVDPTVAESAVRSDPACTGCHAVMDPVASAFWGLHQYILSNDVLQAYRGACAPGTPCFPLPFWDPSATAGWSDHDLPAPAWVGVPVSDLAEMGRSIAADPRFAECTARRFHGWHTGRDPNDVPDEVADQLSEVLIDGDFDARELVVASVLHPDFLTAPPRTIRPEELSRTIEALTGYRWEGDVDAEGCFGGCYGLVDLSTSEAHGFRTLLGGTDGWDVMRPADGPSPTQALSMRWLAEEAAASVVDTDAALPPPRRRLFRIAGPGDAPLGAVREQIALLHQTILTETLPTDGSEVDATLALYEAVEADHGSVVAWTAVVSAMLQDHRLVVF